MHFTKNSEIRQHSMAIYDIATASSEIVYSAGADCFVACWNLTTGLQEAFTVKADFPVYSITLVHSTFLSIGLNNGDLHIIDINSRKEVKFFKQHQSAVFSQLMFNKKKILITGDAEGYLALWNTENWKLELFLPLNCGKIRALTLNKDETKLAIGGQDGIIRIYETEFFNELVHFYAHQDGVNSCAFSNKEDDVLISGGKDGYLRKWNTATGEKISAVPAHNYAVYAISFDESGDYFATCSRDKSIKIWQYDSLTVLQKLEMKNGGHSHSVNKAKWIGKHIISCGDDRRLIRWKLDDVLK